ncbi:MAG: polar amino acid transport system substrate-binding protein [bacterium]
MSKIIDALTQFPSIFIRFCLSLSTFFLRINAISINIQKIKRGSMKIMHFFYILICLLTLNNIAFAEKKEVFLIGANSVPPYKIISGHTLNGINGDIIREVVKKMNVEVRVIQCPFKRCIQNLKFGKIDAFLGLFKTPEREKYFYYIEPPYNNKSNKAFYVHSDSNIKIKKYEDLYQKSIRMIGVTRGYKHFKKFDHDQKLLRIPVNHHLQNFKKLLRRRVDVVILTEIIGDYLLKKNKIKKIRKVQFRYSKINPSYLAISKKSNYMNRVREIEEGLKELIKTKKVAHFVPKMDSIILFKFLKKSKSTKIIKLTI